ncbi:hypothetical protein ETU08_08030 [Apibacter muscae]|uniref:Uncharacterized protein n=1 Tax=Apibacter muscae TaxID=2509004 RepID=A0A563D9G8_9FLAO|nr:hypothetical protein [Apibacter muscae]TWP23292.1 hypothetical protein ETU10_08040 [Apibacter muscae]TWP26860.1 hypothetical protein ETU09_09915 [Apibacter muscae]TWP29222.1 hypothetical protein ETU08_08030 [Apibacter muscae]
MKLKIQLIIGIIFIQINLFSQVGIGIDNPNPHSLLEVYSQNAGILIPRLTEQQRNSLTSSNSTEINLTDTDNSLLIYNTTENCFNYWNSSETEWKSLCGVKGKAKFTINCKDIVINGVYIEGNNLTDSDYISVPVNITKPGTYNIKIITDNNYSFQAEGVFDYIGSYTIKVMGMGTPLKKGENLLTIKSQDLDISCDTAKTISVLPALANVNIQCSTVIVDGVYVVKKPLTETNTIALNVSTTNEGSWEITSNTVNGISFSGSGNFSAAGTYPVTLQGNGTPIESGEYTFKLNASGNGSITNCDFKVKIAVRSMKVLGLGNNTTDGVWNIAGNQKFGGVTNFTYGSLMETDKHFGNNQQATFPVESITMLPLYGESPDLAGTIQSFNPDVIVAEYNFLSGASTSAATVNNIQALVNFVNSGGALVLCMDGDGPTAVRNQNALSITKSIFNDENITVNGLTTARQFLFASANNKIIDGYFFNLLNHNLGSDGGNNFSFTNLPPEKTDYIAYAGSTASNDYISFKHKNKGYLFVGDGAPFSNRYGNIAPYNYPLKFDSSFNPLVNVYSTPPSVNSYFYLNVMAWAFNWAQKHKIQ